jgi:hypothetical protein
MRRKGELSPASIDRGWPHQIALPARLCERGGYQEIHEFCKDLTPSTRGHASTTTASGSTCIVSPSRKMLRNSSNASAATSLIRSNGEKAATRRV